MVAQNLAGLMKSLQNVDLSTLSNQDFMNYYNQAALHAMTGVSVTQSHGAAQRKQRRRNVADFFMNNATPEQQAYLQTNLAQRAAGGGLLSQLGSAVRDVGPIVAGIAVPAFMAAGGLGAAGTEAAATGAGTVGATDVTSTAAGLGAGAAGAGAGAAGTGAAVAGGTGAGAVGTGAAVVGGMGGLGGTDLGFPAGTVGTGASVAENIDLLTSPAVGGGNSLLGMLGNNPISSLMSIGSGLYGTSLGNKQMQLAQQADPFGPYRAGYAAKLAALEANPSDIVNTPGWKAGLQALERTQGAQGYLGSGNAQVDLMDYGANVYDKRIQELMALSGVNISPAVGANIYGQSVDTMGSSLAAFGYGTKLMGY